MPAALGLFVSAAVGAGAEGDGEPGALGLLDGGLRRGVARPLHVVVVFVVFVRSAFG